MSMNNPKIFIGSDELEEHLEFMKESLKNAIEHNKNNEEKLAVVIQGTRERNGISRVQGHMTVVEEGYKEKLKQKE